MLRNNPVSGVDAKGLDEYRVSSGGGAGTIVVTEYSLGNAKTRSRPLEVAGAQMGAFFRRDDDSGCCGSTRWLQVAAILPGEFNGRDGPFVDNNVKSMWPFYGDDFREDVQNPVFSDSPSWPRMDPVLEKMRMGMRFETCLVCRKQGKPASVLGCLQWGFSFEKVPSADRLFPMIFRSSPTDFWRRAVKSDFPEFQYE
jgi:hypothetical protein